MSFLNVTDLSAGYGKKRILEGLSFAVEEGEILGILGANGSGKTTLLKAVCGILTHTGSCRVAQIPLETLSARKLARLCGYVPQRSGISIDLSVQDVVWMGFNPWLGLLEQPTEEMKENARRALAEVGLAGRENENYLCLSEGQKQLCILARALAGSPRLLLLDEPEGALDFRRRHQSLKLLRSWVCQGGRAAAAALHDPDLALNECDTLLLLAEGRISALLKPGSDPLEHMEEQLAKLYGTVSLHRLSDRQGRERLTMLWETEAGREGGTPCRQ